MLRPAKRFEQGWFDRGTPISYPPEMQWTSGLSQRPNMFHSEVDKARNLLTVRYTGRITRAETKPAADEVAMVLGDLQPGFRLLTDMAALESMDYECVPDLKKMMDVCNAKEVGLVVRVIPDPHKDIGMNIMSLFHYRRGVRIVTCETLAEALQVLGA